MGKRIKRVLKWGVFSVLTLLLCLCITLYILYVCGYIHRFILKEGLVLLNKEINGRIEIKRLKGSLLNDISIQDIAVYSDKEAKLLSIKRIDASFSLYQIYQDRGARVLFNRVEIENPDFKMLQDKDDKWGFEDLIKPSSKKTKSRFFLKIDDLYVKNGAYLLKSKNILKYDAKNLNLKGRFILLNDIVNLSISSLAFIGNGISCSLSPISLSLRDGKISISPSRIYFNQSEDIAFAPRIDSTGVVFDVFDGRVNLSTVQAFTPVDMVVKAGLVSIKEGSLGAKDKDFFFRTYAKTDSLSINDEVFYNVNTAISLKVGVLTNKNLSLTYRNVNLRDARFEIDFADLSYNGEAVFTDLNARNFIKIPYLNGLQSGEIAFSGRGFDPKTLYVEASGRLSGGQVYNLPIKQSYADVEYTSALLRIRGARLSIGNAVVSGKGEISKESTKLNINASHVPLSILSGIQGELDYNGLIALRGNRLSLEGRGRLVDIRRGNDAIRLIDLPQIQLYNLNIKDPLYTLNGSLDINAKGVRTKSFSVPHASIHLAFIPGLIQVYDLHLASDYPRKTSLSFAGGILISRNRYEVNTDFLYVRDELGELIANGQQDITITDRHVEIVRLCFDLILPAIKKDGQPLQKDNLDRQQITAEGIYAFDGPGTDIRIDGHNINLEIFKPLLPTDLLLNGLVKWYANIRYDTELKLVLNMDIINPSVGLVTALVDDGMEPNKKQDAFYKIAPAEKPFAADSIKVEGEIPLKAPINSINLKGFNIYQGSSLSWIKGSFPISRNGKFNLDCDINLVDTDVLSPAGEIFTLYKGKINYKGSLKGTPIKPDLSGYASIYDAEVYFRPLSTLLTSFQVRALLQENRIEFMGNDKWGRPYEIRAMDEKEGRLLINGFIELNMDSLGFGIKNLEMRIKANNLFVDIIPMVEAYTDIDASLTGTKDKFLLEGDINLNECMVTIPFGQNNNQQPVRDAGMIEYGLNIYAPGKIWLHNDEADLEMSLDGGIRWQGTNMFFMGVLDVIRGSYYLYGTEFNITEGRLFFLSTAILDPRLNIQAYTIIPSEISGGLNTTITVNMTGTLSKPVVDFEASTDAEEKAALTQQDILTMIALNTTMKEMREKKGYELYKKGLEKGIVFASYTASRGLTEKLGLAAFYLKPTITANDPSVSINLGKYLFGSLYLNYSQGFLKSTDLSAGLDWVLNRNHSLYFSYVKEKPTYDNPEIQRYWGWRFSFRF